MFRTFKPRLQFKYGGKEFGFVVVGQGLMMVRMIDGVVSISKELEPDTILLSAEDLRDLRDILNSEDFDVEEVA